METVNCDGVDWSVWPTKEGPRAKSELNDTFPITIKTSATDAVVYTKESVKKLIGLLAKSIGEENPVETTNKKSKGASNMAKKTVTQVLKKEAAEVALRTACNTAGKQLKKSAVAALKAAEHPMAKEAAKFLDTSHGQALIMLCTGVLIHMLPEKVGGNEKAALLAQNFRLAGMSHFGDLAADGLVDVFVDPLIASLAKPLAAAGDVLAALPGAVAGDDET